jgi:hypothetical protein
MYIIYIFSYYLYSDGDFFITVFQLRKIILPKGTRSSQGPCLQISSFPARLWRLSSRKVPDRPKARVFKFLTFLLRLWRLSDPVNQGPCLQISYFPARLWRLSDQVKLLDDISRTVLLYNWSLNVTVISSGQPTALKRYLPWVVGTNLISTKRVL